MKSEKWIQFRGNLECNIKNGLVVLLDSGYKSSREIGALT